MREIKFRGKDCSGQWVYGDLIHKRHDKESILIQDYKGLGSDVDTTTIGQYTGLKDKNNKEIYEGDIIRSYDSENKPIIHFIHWHNLNACYVATIPQYSCICSIVTRDWIKEYDKEIIGNIHDNPELIKEEK